jgi:8-oxo-dGTP pyrophosphatase MutT (NUDIX family)
MRDFIDSPLIWKPVSKKAVCQTRVLKVIELDSQSPMGDTRSYTIIESPDWVTVIPVIETPREQFVMVRQWRHGENRITAEFPGGVINAGESAEEAAKRELLEETGYEASKIVRLAPFSPNPALMTNHQHFCLAFDLRDTKKTHPDDDEYVYAFIEDAESVFARMEAGEYSHGLMVCGAFLYQRYKARQSRRE